MVYDERQSILEFIRNLELNFNELVIFGIKTFNEEKIEIPQDTLPEKFHEQNILD